MNLHGLPRYHLKVVRLPISPPGLKVKQYMRSLGGVEGKGLPRTVRETGADILKSNRQLKLRPHHKFTMAAVLQNAQGI